MPDERAAGGGRCRAPQHRRHAEHELARGERLGQVVVGTQIEPGDPFRLVPSCGQHDNGNRVLPAEPSEHLEPVQPGEHEVKNEQDRRVDERVGQPGPAVGAGREPLALGFR